MLVPAHTVVKLPDALSFKTGAAISCGTGTAYGALKRLDLAGDETIAIFGQGPVGLGAAQLAKAMGARVIALDISKERRDLATKFGADEIVDPVANDVVEAIRDLTHGEGAQKSLDYSSTPKRVGLRYKQSASGVRRALWVKQAMLPSTCPTTSFDGG